MRRLNNLFTSPKISNQPVATKYQTHIIFAQNSFDTDTDQALFSSSPEESANHHNQYLNAGLSQPSKKFNSKARHRGPGLKRYFKK